MASFVSAEPSKPVVQISDHQNTIEAEDLSPVTLTIGDNVTALVNTSITIQCPTSGVPKPSVTWTKDGQELLSGGRYKVQDNGSLVISDASEEDNAQYTCTADSVTGKDSASSIVQVESKFSSDPPQKVKMKSVFKRAGLCFVEPLYKIDNSPDYKDNNFLPLQYRHFCNVDA